MTPLCDYNQQIVPAGKIKKPKDIADHMRHTLRKFRLKHGMPGPAAYKLNALFDNLIQFGDPRPRNPLGQFSDQESDVADPNTMATTYRSVGRTALKGAEIGGAATIAGAGGAVGSSAVKALLEKLKRARK